MTEKQTNKKESNLDKELKEISSPSVKKMVERVDKDKLALNGATYEVVTDHKEALDLEMLEARYSELLEKYDYIVGDISYDKLRLRGFYEDHVKKVPIDMRISSLEDYLLEYCSFGCKYFVLKRLDPKKKGSVDHSEPQKKRSSRKRKRRSSRKPNTRQGSQQPKRQPRSKSSKSNSEKPAKKDFVQKEVGPDKPQEKKGSKKEVNVQTVKDKKGNTRFQIRRKKSEENK